jgi:aarF domain-containing kinase
VTQVLLDFVDATENNGLKFPREFGLLVKQSLYFDRYLKILAPNLDVMADERVSGLGSESSTSLPPSRNNGNNSNFDGDIIDVEMA